MTQVAFTPTATAAFQFSAELDGSQYNVIVTWNVSGQRWFVTVAQPDGTRVVTVPLVSSGASFPISLVAGYFTSTLTYRSGTQIFEILP